LSARSYLYVPGVRPDRFDKALSSGADAIILDLEDAVPHAEKDDARRNVVAWLREHPNAPALVRVNGGALLIDDVRAVAAAGARCISIPKASAEECERASVVAELPVIALLETAEAILDARAIASCHNVVRLAIGEADLGAELNVDASDDGREMWPMRAQVVLASAAAKIAPPVAPISTDFNDLEAFAASTHALKRAGFGARAAIHPAQVAAINETFTPSDEEVEAARKLLAAFDAAGGGVCLDERGRMVDEAIVRAARRTLDLAARRAPR
jgi:citrate lyase subunit beta/citryl-CoA lyase